MKKQRKKSKTEVVMSLLQGSTTFYLMLMVSVFPLFFDEYYLNIVLTKKNFFQWSTIALLVVVFVLMIATHFWEKPKKRKKSKISLTDIFAIMFGITILISSWLSPVGSEAFWGNQVRRLGGFFFLICVGAYFIVSRYYKTSKWLIVGFVLTNLISYLIVAIQFFGYDIFHMYENLIVEQHLSFMGTMGNVNVNAGYFGMIVSLMMGFYYISTKKPLKICFWGMTVWGVYTCYCTRSDSWILAVGMAFFVLLFLSVKKKESMKTWWDLYLAFFCGSLMIKLTEFVEANTDWTSLFVANIRANSFIAFMVSKEMLAAEAMSLLLCYFLIKSRHVSVLQKYGTKILTVVAVCAGIGLIVYLYPIEDSFGNARGYIWKRSILNFKKFPMIQKLFGYGPNCFYQAIQVNYGAEMMEKYQSVFYDAHNEILQFLTVTGIFGVVSYMGMQISVWVSCIQKKKALPEAILGIVVVVAYIAQGMVNNPQVFTTPLLFLFLGIMEQKLRRKD